MQKTKLISKVIAGAMLSFILATLGGQVVQAQNPVSLLRAKCVNSGFGSTRQNISDISIGKAVYTSSFYMGPGNRSASITCKIQPEQYPEPIFQTLQLEFGMRDNDQSSPPVTVKVYLDGKETDTKTVAPAQKESLSLDVSNVSNVAIETVCSTQSEYCNRVYFLNASLEPKPLAPVPSK